MRQEGTVASGLYERWEIKSLNNESMIARYGFLKCTLRINDTTIVVLAGWYNKNYPEPELPYLIYYNIQDNIWLAGTKISRPIRPHRIYSCLVDEDNLLVEAFWDPPSKTNKDLALPKEPWCDLTVNFRMLVAS